KHFTGKVKVKEALNQLLRDAPFETSASSAPTGLAAAAASLLGNGAGDGSLIDKTPQVDDTVQDELEDLSLKGENVMEILDELSRQVNAEFLVSDKKVHFGRPIKSEAPQIDEFDRDVNLAIFRPI